MEETRHIPISDYDYVLPEDRIAKYPVSPRDHSKLLVYKGGTITDGIFQSLPEYLPKGELMVFNNTRVIQARLRFHKESGALIEVFCLEPYLPADYEQMFARKKTCQWLCLVGNSKKWKEGKLSLSVLVEGVSLSLTAEKVAEKGGSHVIQFDWNHGSLTFAEVLDAMGQLPIPPYLKRDTEESDKETYQTVYSKIKGSVAAPTAGLHFTNRVLASLDNAGIEREEVTLHVGAGTFRPVKADTIDLHEMHSETISVSRKSIEALIRHGGRCIAVGTTSVRTLESLYYIGVKIYLHPETDPEELQIEQWYPYESEARSVSLSTTDALRQILVYLERQEETVLHTSTRIIIIPGYTYHVVRWLITNFHQPKSTLLLLVSAFVGEDWRKIYHYALERDFRFLSYGDSSLLIP